MTSETGPRLIVALDYAERDAADALVRQLDPGLCRLKIGNELFTRAGPSCLEQWRRLGFDIFLDLKYHDIPNTVGAACRAAADIGAWMVNIHAMGGQRMLEAARASLRETSQRPLLVAVTVLTSMDESDLVQLGMGMPASELVLGLTGMASAAGCDGVVCSAREAETIRDRFGESLTLVTPGIRPAGVATDDQRRTATPAVALQAGADYLVVGRPVTAAADPLKAVQALTREIKRSARP